MRLFVAIQFDASFKDAVLRCQSELRRVAASGNFSRPENLHMTLAFIGEVPTAEPALRAVKSVAVSPFELRLAESGRFGSLYWIGVESGGGAEELAEAVRVALKREGVAYDTKPFKPHITLAREVKLQSPFRCAVPKAKMTVSRIALMKSERVNGKLIYSEIK